MSTMFERMWLLVQESSAQLAMGEAFGIEAPKQKVPIPCPFTYERVKTVKSHQKMHQTF